MKYFYYLLLVFMLSCIVLAFLPTSPKRTNTQPTIKDIKVETQQVEDDWCIANECKG